MKKEEIWLKHSKGDVNFAHDNDMSSGNNFVFVNIYGARGGNLVDFSLSLGSVKKLRDWLDTVLEDRSLPTPPPLKPWQKRAGQLEEREQRLLGYQSERDKKDLELAEAKQRIKELEQVLTDMKYQSWWKRLFRKK